jgi:chemotaxis protein CheX
MTADLAKEFEKRMRPQIEGLGLNLIVDLRECEDFHPTWTRVLMQLASLAKGAGRKIRLVAPNDGVFSFLRQQGISSSLPASPTIEVALQELSAKKTGKIDVNFINPILEGTVEVLKVQARTAARPGTPIPRGPKEPLGGDISGVVGLTTDSFAGSVVFTFPAETFLKIISRMLGEECKELTPEISDGAAELTNIIFGYAKRVLNEKGYGVRAAVPSVISGKEPTLQNSAGNPRISIPFESDAGNFAIEISVGEERSPQ